MSDINLDDFDFGFTTVSEADINDAATEKVSVEVQNKAEAIYKMILPLLKNLEKDADKNEYIHWPNRKEKIQMFIKKLDEVLKS